ncbi:MAG: SHOCT domain-containing protein [Promethearchaeota archaeon]|jgi:uncharacterized membrane protein
MIGNIVLDCGGLYHMADWGHMMWSGFPLFWIGLIGLFIVLIIVVFLVIILGEKKDEKEVMSDAQKILDERYVKGEITQKEYLQFKEDLKK